VREVVNQSMRVLGNALDSILTEGIKQSASPMADNLMISMDVGFLN